MITSQVTGALGELGFIARTDVQVHQAVTHFQQAWLIGPLVGKPPLRADGEPGPKTAAALQVSIARARRGLGSASEHFGFAEFACTCDGRYPECLGVLVAPALLVGLERLRSVFFPGGLRPESGYRCVGRNHELSGAAEDSMHLRGAASDVPMTSSRVTTSNVRKLRVFSGIGYQRSTGRVRHVDVRGQGGVAQTTPGASPASPATWVYC